MKKKKKIKTNDKIEFTTQRDLKELQELFFTQFNYNYWIHKANVLTHFIDNLDAIKILKYEEDIYSEEVINENLKLELHMSVFHSSESLFRIIFAITKMPNFPWIWIAKCSPQELNDLIRSLKQNGLSSISNNPEIWLRENLYPTIINDKDPNYDKSVKSGNFVIEYLQRLAFEYVDHTEYNSYKHGLHCFPGVQHLQAISEQTGQTCLDSKTDIIQFLEIKKLKNMEKNKRHIQIANKTYDSKQDYTILRINCSILNNLFQFKSLSTYYNSLELHEKVNIRHIYYYFDDWLLNDIFPKTTNTHTGGLVKRVSH